MTFSRADNDRCAVIVSFVFLLVTTMSLPSSTDANKSLNS